MCIQLCRYVEKSAYPKNNFKKISEVIFRSAYKARNESHNDFEHDRIGCGNYVLIKAAVNF